MPFGQRNRSTYAWQASSSGKKPLNPVRFPFGRVVLDSDPGFQPFGLAGGLYDGETRAGAVRGPGLRSAHGTVDERGPDRVRGGGPNPR